MDKEFNKIMNSLKPWQKKIIEKRISAMESEIYDLIRIITSDTKENLQKYELLASFVGWNYKNACNLSLEALKFLYKHKKELKSKISIDDILTFSETYCTFTVVKNRKPKDLAEMSDLFSFFRTPSGFEVKSIKDYHNACDKIKQV